jgi:hypothetical protein
MLRSLQNIEDYFNIRPEDWPFSYELASSINGIESSLSSLIFLRFIRKVCELNLYGVYAFINASKGYISQYESKKVGDFNDHFQPGKGDFALLKK